MSAQLAMLRADQYCPDADNLYFVGSDCIAYDTLTPEPYCDVSGKPAVLMSAYSVMNVVHSDTLPWQRGVNRILGFKPDYEYMRRLPSVFPRTIFAPMRAEVERIHGTEFDDYIYTANDGTTSEANLLGAYAHKYMPETCRFVDIAEAGLYGSQVNGWPSTLMQLWSWGGLDRPMDACVEYKFRGVSQQSVGRTPRRVINEILYPQLFDK
jgi:hypothetical protein